MNTQLPISPLINTEYKTQLEHLDYVLKSTLHDRDYADVVEALLKEEVLPKNDEHYLRMIVNKLHEDGYVDFTEGEPNRRSFIKGREAGYNMYVRRNFKGHIFLSNGGYTGLEEKKHKETMAIYNMNERMEKNEENLVTWTENLADRTKELTRWTKWVGFGAVGLVIWEIFDELVLKNLHFFATN